LGLQIPQSTIETIRDRTDIAEIVSQYVELRRTGSSFKGLCPFHQEKTPSFNVSPDRQIFHCFGCGIGGDVFKFLMEIDGISFVDAVRQLGSRCGVEVAYRDNDPDKSKNDARFAANAFAARFYYRILKDSRSAAKARDYLSQRGIPVKAWETFGIGYSPNSWDALWSAARRERVPERVLAELKLIVKSEKSKGYYDYFRNRVMFPIINVGGRVIGFGARSLGDDEPKYLNSAESPIFSKRRTFYGVNHARDAIRKARSAVVVEGYTDLISLHLLGITHTVAACGTAFTPDHATVLRRITQRAVILPDGDAAGENAAVTAGAIMLAAGIDVRVRRLPAGSDPDNLAREAREQKDGAAAVTQLLENAYDYFAFLKDVLEERQPTVREREDLMQRALGGITHLDDRVRADVIVGELASAFEVDAGELGKKRAAAARRMRTPDPGRTTGPPAGGNGRPAGAGSRVAVERLALRLIMEGTPAALDAVDSLDTDDFTEADLRKFYKTLDLARESHIDIRGREFHQKAEEAGLDGLAAEIALIPLPPGNVEILLKDTIRRIKELNIRDELTELRKKLQELPPESEEAVAVAEYFHKLKQALVEL
jgi:DNA primase